MMKKGINKQHQPFSKGRFENGASFVIPGEVKTGGDKPTVQKWIPPKKVPGPV